jgi:hypothetical protein
MEEQVVAAVAQFGVAGLIGWMWLTERRSSAAREQQLSELHERVLHDRTTTDVLISVVSANTRAMTALENSQRELAGAIDRGGASPGRAA